MSVLSVKVMSVWPGWLGAMRQDSEHRRAPERSWKHQHLTAHPGKMHQCTTTQSASQVRSLPAAHFLSGFSSFCLWFSQGLIGTKPSISWDYMSVLCAGSYHLETKHYVMLFVWFICCIFRLLQHVPFRESKLTHYLQGFFCGRGKACMIVNVNQCASMYDETVNVLKFSAVAQKVHTFVFNYSLCGRLFISHADLCYVEFSLLSLCDS